MELKGLKKFDKILNEIKTEAPKSTERFLMLQAEELKKDVRDQVNINIKYEGYIKRQESQVKQFKKLENKKIPLDIDYTKVNSLRIEAVQKLSKVRPSSIGQASRISGVSPADITVLLVYLETYKEKKDV